VKYAERPAAGDAEGALVLFHGRGADEYDLLGLLDELDPDRHLDGYCPRGPLAMPPGGAHWYAVPRVGYPDPATFAEGFAAAAGFVDGLKYERIVLGGFSQGAVMALSVALGDVRPRPAAVIAFSGFLPEVEGWSLGGEPWPPIAIGHGTLDEIIPVEFAHRSRDRLVAAGATVLYRESLMGHSIDPSFVRDLRGFVRTAANPGKGA
jgi:phospholipase/carboxylesterase